MSAALKLNMEAEQLSQKPPLGEKMAKPRLVWENPNLSHGVQKEKPEVKPEPSYGRVLYNYFRDYDPATGRYVQSDPIGIKGGLNTYLYANASPYRYIDPRGQNAGVGVGVGIITFCRLYPSACIAAGYALCRALGGCDAPVISPIPYHNDSGEGCSDEPPVIIDDSTKTEDKVKDAVKSADEDLIDDEMAKEKTLKQAQNKRRKRQRQFERGDFEGDYDGFLDDLNKHK